MHVGDWFNIGLPHYIDINRNPENGLEVQNSAYGECEIMMGLNLVKGGSDHDNIENGVTNGAAVLMELVLPWLNTHRIVYAERYFSLVVASELLYLNGLKFIGDDSCQLLHLFLQGLEHVCLLMRRNTKNISNNCPLVPLAPYFYEYSRVNRLIRTKKIAQKTP